MSERLAAALHYASLGWHVFPVQRATLADDRSGKRPAGSIVHNGKDDATTDAEQIKRWWSQGDWNIGISCEPSKLVVLDVDVALKQDGTHKKGRESLAAIDDKLHGSRTAITGSGGLHIFYTRPDDFTTGSKIGFADGLDLISNGYVVAAPSDHYSGGTYHWHNDAAITALPEYLRSVGKLQQAKVHAEAAGVTKIEEGGRNNALFRFGAALYNSTAMARETLLSALRSENSARFVPPLPDDEVRQLTNNILARVQPQRDAALGAVIEQDLSKMFDAPNAPATDAPKVDDAVSRGIDLVASLEQQSKLPVVHLPYKQLEDKLNGLSLNSITLLVAGTGKGKSSLAANFSLHHASSGQGPLIYYVGEMTRELVLARFIGVRLKRSWSDVLRGEVPRDEMVKAIEGLPLYFVKRSPEPITAIAKALKMAREDGMLAEGKVPMLVIDYIQLLASVGADMRVSTMQAVRDLRQFVEDAPVVALVLSQSSRTNSKQMKEGGTAEDMIGMGAETAELEQSATNQLVLSFQSNEDTHIHDVTMMVAKSRFGGGSKLGFTFNGRTGEWLDTEELPIPPKMKERCDSMLEHIQNHVSNKCTNGMFCGCKMNKARFLDKKGAHWVSGNDDAHTAALELLEKKHQIRCEGGQYYPCNTSAKPGV